MQASYMMISKNRIKFYIIALSRQSKVHINSHNKSWGIREERDEIFNDDRQT